MTLKYFKISEFDSPDEPGSGSKMCPEFLEKLDLLREHCGFPFALAPGAGYRTKEYNDKIGGAHKSAHMEGRAADISCNAQQAYTILKNAPGYGFSGIGVKQRDGSRFVHLDDAHEVGTVWTY